MLYEDQRMAKSMDKVYVDNNFKDCKKSNVFGPQDD